MGLLSLAIWLPILSGAVLLVAFSAGIAIGSVSINALLKGEVSPRYVPMASIMMTVFLIDLYFAAGHAHAAPHSYTTEEATHRC